MPPSYFIVQAISWWLELYSLPESEQGLGPKSPASQVRISTKISLGRSFSVLPVGVVPVFMDYLMSTESEKNDSIACMWEVEHLHCSSLCSNEHLITF